MKNGLKSITLNGGKKLIEVQALEFNGISGKPLGESVAWRGSIVMNTKEELQVAFDDKKRDKLTYLSHIFIGYLSFFCGFKLLIGLLKKELFSESPPSSNDTIIKGRLLGLYPFMSFSFTRYFPAGKLSKM